jgi:signal transduction histidine kinase
MPAQPQAQQQPETLRVLILNSYDESTVPYAQGRSAFIAELPRLLTPAVAFRQYDLEARGSEPETDQDLKLRVLLSRFGDMPPDLVVAIGPPAVDFCKYLRAGLPADTPFVFIAASQFTDAVVLRPADAAIAADIPYAERVHDILRLRPETTDILIVFGASRHERELASAAGRELEALFPENDFSYTNDLSLRELEIRLGQLPEGFAVLYGFMDSDPHGVVLNQLDALRLLRAASSAPVFGMFYEQLGHGIVGGRLMRVSEIGREAARSAAEILREGAARNPRKLVETSAPTYDWRELQAWNIDPDRLQPGSIVQFKPPSLLEQYFGWVVLIALALLVQSLLVGALLLQHRRRRRAELASRDLGSRLINAHEEERRRIARELHDDLSQRLARLSIDASYVAGNPGTEASHEILQNMQPELVRVSKDVHDMSYRLHPSLLEDLGLAPALQAECDRLRRRSGVRIVERIGELPAQLPQDVALCIYRIAQEALHNAIRHAKAGTIEIAVENGAQALSLTVRDDGLGFDAADSSTRSGLGLSSMRERARLAGGSLQIRSRPGHGATVSFTLPGKVMKK